tara:strand:- start:153 stop:401 length:249 start_codon:yes stop_codon:yes gene_type:complete
MISMREDLVKACRLYLKGNIEKHKVNVENMMENSVGVGSNSDIMESLEKELTLIAEYENKLEVLNKYFSLDYEPKNKEVLNG